MTVEEMGMFCFGATLAGGIIGLFLVWVVSK